MRLKMFALTGTAIILWVLPLYSLDKKVSWHRAIQGVSLMAAFACALEASRTAKKLTKDEAFAHAKEVMLIGDLQDELAQSAYLSEQERKIQNQRYLESLNENLPQPTENERERLERLLVLSSETERSQENCEVLGLSRLEQVRELRELGWGKAKIILHLWGISKGGSAKYKAAESEYENLISKLEDEQ